jgi:iron complex outermembrane receptor protein
MVMKMQIKSFYKIVSLIVLLIFAVIITNDQLFAEEQIKATEELPYDLTDVNLSDLLNLELEVTSPAKKPQSLSSVASALFVLTARDIRRSGATHIADALRLVPGINVAQVNGNQWAITARGLNNTFARHLLVLLDGQSIFTPGFNGVFWDQYDIDLDNVERIEVIKGPGAAVWGSNAVNGVINIITYKASHTQGNRVVLGGGTREQARASMRHGGSIDQHTHYRAYTKLSQKADNQYKTGENSNDGYDSLQTGFRLDKEVNEKDQFMFISNLGYTDKYLRDDAPSIIPPYVDSKTYSGDKEQYVASLISKYSRNYSKDESAHIQFDYNLEKQLGKIFPLVRHTAHVEAQHRQKIFGNNDFIYGGSYRFNYDDIEGNFADNFVPQIRNTNLITMFAHNEVPLVEDKLILTLGSKFEYNSHTQYEFMPNARLLWKVKENTSIWTAISRAVAIRRAYLIT